jgi:hypothetical protein
MISATVSTVSCIKRNLVFPVSTANLPWVQASSILPQESRSQQGHTEPPPRAETAQKCSECIDKIWFDMVFCRLMLHITEIHP